MNSRLRLLAPLLLLLLLLGGALWIALTTGDPEASPPPATEQTDPDVESNRDERARVRSTESDAETDPDAAETEAAEARTPDEVETHLLKIVVREPGGAPAGDVRVQITDRQGTMDHTLPDRMWLADGRTDADGTLRLRIPQGRSFGVAASGHGMAAVKGNLSGRAAGDREIELTLQPAPVIRGRLLDPDGAPVPDHPVAGWFRTVPLSHWTHVVRATTDANGYFEFDDVPLDHRARIVEIRALRRPGVWPAVKHFKPADLQRELEIRALHTTRIKGRFVRADGRVLDGATLEAVSEDWNFDLRTDEDGRVDQEVPRASLGLFFRSEHAPAWQRESIDAPGAVLDLGEVTVDAGVSLRGSVLHPDGSPAAGAKVTVQRRSVRADDRGRFELANLAPGRHSLKAQADRPHIWVDVDIANVEVGVPATEEVVQLSGARFVDITLVDEVGEPREVARVSVRVLADPPRVVYRRSWRGKGSRVRFRAPPVGTYRIEIEAEGHDPTEVTGVVVSEAGPAVHKVPIVPTAD